MDKLVLYGFGKRLDGEYPCELRDLMVMDDPNVLTTREREVVYRISGVTMANTGMTFATMHSSLMLALVVVLLKRLGKSIDEDDLWEARCIMTGEDSSFSALREAKKSFFAFVIGDSDEEESESPPDEPAETPETEQPSTSGGKSSVLTLANPDSPQSGTGAPDLVMSVTSSQAASGT